MKTFTTLTFLMLLGSPLASQSVLDVPPRNRPNERAVTGGGQKVNVDSEVPLPKLIERLNGEWQEVETGKAYWFGYTDDMYSIAAHGEEAIEPLLKLATTTPSAHTKYGALLTLHLIGIDRKIAGRFIETFKNFKAREALLKCLVDDSLRDQAMLMLIRDPWPSDVPRLMEVMRSSKSDCWTIVNGLFRYKLENVPFRHPIPDSLAKKEVTFVQPENISSDQFFWDILIGMKKAAGELLMLEDGLLQRSQWGYAHRGYGSGNEGSKTMAFADILNDVVESDPTFSYCDLGNRIQYFVENGVVHVCSSQTSKERWLKWWDAQPDEYKKKLGSTARPEETDSQNPAPFPIHK